MRRGDQGLHQSEVLPEHQPKSQMSLRWRASDVIPQRGRMNGVGVLHQKTVVHPAIVAVNADQDCNFGKSCREMGTRSSR